MCIVLCYHLIGANRLDSAFLFAKEINKNELYDACYNACISKGDIQLAKIIKDIQERQ